MLEWGGDFQGIKGTINIEINDCTVILLPYIIVFKSGIAKFYQPLFSATIPRSCVWRKSRFLELSIGQVAACWCLGAASSRLLPNHPMDRASQVLAQGVPPGVPKSYRALADHGNVPRSTLHHRAHGRRSIEEKAQSQQYLTPLEEDIVVKFLLQMSDLGQPIRIKFISSIAFSVTRQRPKADRPLKPPGKNWAKALENRTS
jgi:hypothetical protein